MYKLSLYMQILHLWFRNERKRYSYRDFSCIYSCNFFIDSTIGDKQRVKVDYGMLHKVMFLRHNSIFKLWIFFFDFSTDRCLGNISVNICGRIFIIRRALCLRDIRKYPFYLWIYSTGHCLNFYLISREFRWLAKYVVYENIL